MNIMIENKGYGDMYVVYRVHSGELVARFFKQQDAYEYLFTNVYYA